MPELHFLMVQFGTNLVSKISNKDSINGQLALLFGANKVQIYCTLQFWLHFLFFLCIDLSFCCYFCCSQLWVIVPLILIFTHSFTPIKLAFSLFHYNPFSPFYYSLYIFTLSLLPFCCCNLNLMSLFVLSIFMIFHSLSLLGYKSGLCFLYFLCIPIFFSF